MISSKNKIFDYNIPQRQAAAGIIIEMFFSIKTGLQVLWPLMLILILQVKKTGLLIPSVAILAIIPVMIIIGYLNYRNFLFYIDKEKEEF